MGEGADTQSFHASFGRVILLESQWVDLSAQFTNLEVGRWGWKFQISKQGLFFLETKLYPEVD